MPSVKGFSKSKDHLSPEQKFLSELILMDDIFMRIVLKDRKSFYKPFYRNRT